ncbi:hypothetical protein pdam_00017821 [Pocillopora damicornis]|uniref:Uncharacterized protein n=2 Tax=Pocillopora TaxID=46730 RepID=A0A3M6TYW9_POCDA|nr:hypothetical protein pdam_00017821 [Pocillopora damicornis]
MQWTTIAQCLGVSPKTLYRKRLEYGFEDSFTDISDEELECNIRDVLRLTPFSDQSKFLKKAVSEIAHYGPAGLQIENKMSDEWVFHIRKQPRSKERLKREKGIGCIIKSVGEKRRKSQIDLASSETYKTTTEEITQKNNMKQVRDEAHTKVQARKDIIPDKYHERKENQNKDDAL